MTPSDAKPLTQEFTKPQVTVTIDPQEPTAKQYAAPINPDFMRPHAASTPEFTRAVSVSSTSSSVIRPSPTPSIMQMQTEPERERSLKESERLNFPSPPPSDSEFEVPVRQPFAQSARDINLHQRKRIKPIEEQVPEMEWTQLVPEPVPTPPGSSARSSSPSDSMDVDDLFDDADGDDVLQLTSAPADEPVQQSDIRVNAITPRPGPKKRVAEDDDTSQKQSDASKGRVAKRTLPEKAAIPKKKAVQLKEWERREFVAPREDELKEKTSDKGEDKKDIKAIPFADVRRLLPPAINAQPPAKYQAYIDSLRRLLYPESTSNRLELYLNQLAWVVHQMTVGPPEYRAVLGKPQNLTLLGRFLSDAYNRSKDEATKAITKWRSIKAAYLTIQVSCLCNGLETLINDFLAAFTQDQSQ